MPRSFTPFSDHSARQRGVALIEYALLLALIAVVCIVALTSLGGEDSSKVQSPATTITTSAPNVSASTP